MDESKGYLLDGERYVTVNIDSNNSEIYKINSDGTRTIYADYNNGALTASSFSSQQFQRNLAQGNYTNTINQSIGTQPQNVGTDPNTSLAGGTLTTNTDSNLSSTSVDASGDLRYPLSNDGSYDYLKISTHELNRESLLGEGQQVFEIKSPDKTVKLPLIV